MGKKSPYYIQVTRRCDTCDELFKPSMDDVNRGYGHFCSLRCSTKYRNKIHPPVKVERIKLNCPICSLEFERLVTASKYVKTKLLFCSRKCKDMAQRVGGLPELKPVHYKDGSTYYRERALKYYGAKCCKCGYDRYEAVLQVHHKDRNRANGDIANLQVYCPTCHLEDHYLAGDGFFTPHSKKLEASSCIEQPSLAGATGFEPV